MDEKVRKRVLRMIPYGLYVATALHEGQVAAGTITWLSQASFKPPLVMTALKADSYLYHQVKAAGAFAVNILGTGQKDLAAAFFRGAQVQDGKLNGYAFEPGPETGAPLLLDAPAWFEARVTDVVERGDHAVVVAEVVSVGLRNPEAQPLLLQETGWQYGG